MHALHDLLSARDVAGMLGISIYTLYNMVRYKRIPCVRFGQDLKFDPAACGRPGWPPTSSLPPSRPARVPLSHYSYDAPVSALFARRRKREWMLVGCCWHRWKSRVTAREGLCIWGP
jgi:Helix-turn-helix domain